MIIKDERPLLPLVRDAATGREHVIAPFIEAISPLFEDFLTSCLEKDKYIPSAYHSLNLQCPNVNLIFLRYLLRIPAGYSLMKGKIIAPMSCRVKESSRLLSVVSFGTSNG